MQESQRQRGTDEIIEYNVIKIGTNFGANYKHCF